MDLFLIATAAFRIRLASLCFRSMSQDFVDALQDDVVGLGGRLTSQKMLKFTVVCHNQKYVTALNSSTETSNWQLTSENG